MSYALGSSLPRTSVVGRLSSGVRGCGSTSVSSGSVLQVTAHVAARRLGGVRRLGRVTRSSDGRFIRGLGRRTSGRGRRSSGHVTQFRSILGGLRQLSSGPSSVRIRGHGQFGLVGRGERQSEGNCVGGRVYG